MMRRNLGWTQQDLADRSGIARANVARLETGRHTPMVETVERLARAFEVPAAELMREPTYAAGSEDASWLESGTGEWSKALDKEDSAS